MDGPGAISERRDGLSVRVVLICRHIYQLPDHSEPFVNVGRWALPDGSYAQPYRVNCLARVRLNRQHHVRVGVDVCLDRVKQRSVLDYLVAGVDDAPANTS